IT
ncbi:elongation factor 4 domain protein, partial [Chlamydia psittaci 84-8471/1]